MLNNAHAAGARVSKRVLLFTNRDDPLKSGEEGGRFFFVSIMIFLI